MANREKWTGKQVEQEMRRLRRVFSSVRLLEEDEIGALTRHGEGPCFEGWGGSACCEDCVARKALEGKTRRSKLERRGADICEITAVWMQVDGKDCVMELCQELEPEVGSRLLDSRNVQPDSAMRDMLTGAYNRRYYDEQYSGKKLTAGVAMLDLDDVGFSNDLYGHYAGDAMLETAVRVIRKCMDAHDRLIRYGGDELLLIQPDIPQESFADKLEQIRMQLYAAAVPGYARVQLSASIGGVWVRDTEADSAVDRAERLMRFAKPQKNTVVTSETGPSSSGTSCRQSVLIVDDSAMNRRMLREILGRQFDTAEAASGEECLRLLDQNRTGISIVLLDIHMTGIDGFTVLEAMNQQNMLEDIPVIMISSEDNVDTVRRAFDLGASDYISRPFDAKVVYKRIINTIRLYAKQRRLSAVVADRVYETEQNSRMMIRILTRVMERRNGESQDHVRRVEVITSMLLAHLAQKSEQYGLSREMRRRITMAAALHDIGKMEVDERLLHRADLQPEEKAALRLHTVRGGDLLERAGIGREDFVQVAVEIARWHHERYDGSGYPDGLVGEQIPLSAQVVGLADAYEALTSGENGPAYPPRAAVHRLCSTMQGQFSPMLLHSLQEISGALEPALQRPEEQELW